MLYYNNLSYFALVQYYSSVSNFETIDLEINWRKAFNKVSFISLTIFIFYVLRYYINYFYYRFLQPYCFIIRLAYITKYQDILFLTLISLTSQLHTSNQLYISYPTSIKSIQIITAVNYHFRDILVDNFTPKNFHTYYTQ